MQAKDRYSLPRMEKAMRAAALPPCSTFAKEVQQAIKNGVALGTRQYSLNMKDQQKVHYYRAHQHKIFFICELYDLLQRLWHFDQVTSSLLSQLWNPDIKAPLDDMREQPDASAHCQHKLRDSCQFSAMGNLLVHLKYASHASRRNANVYRKRIE